MTPLEIALVLALIALAAVAAWLLHQRTKLASERDIAVARLGDEQRMKESFASLAGQVLDTSNKRFLELAESKLATKQTQAAAELDQRTTAFASLVKPIAETLKKTEEKLVDIDRKNAGLAQQVGDATQASFDLRKETARLVQALSKPQVRGRYGEIQLERVAELAGMRSYCDFASQDFMRDAEGNLLRPDMIVRLPNERVIAVDAKTNLEHYLQAVDATTPELAEAALVRFAEHVANQTRLLSKKGYWKELQSSPELVVMFVPGDQFIDAALQRRPDLIELAANHNIVLASPSTLIGLLRAVHVGWREKSLTDNALELFKLGSELHKRLGTAFTYADRLGRNLETALKSYNEFVGSVDGRLMPTLRKFEELGAQTGTPAGELREVEIAVRRLAEVPEAELKVDQPTSSAGAP